MNEPVRVVEVEEKPRDIVVRSGRGPRVISSLFLLACMPFDAAPQRPVLLVDDFGRTAGDRDQERRAIPARPDRKQVDAAITRAEARRTKRAARYAREVAAGGWKS